MGKASITAQAHQRRQPKGEAVPPGWTTNPSAPGRRLVLASLATLGFLTALYLTLYQTDVLSSVWEPFFGDGSRTVLNSSLSRALPVPDSALGAAVYFFDALLLFAGGEDRWESHSWFVLANGATAAALGIAGVSLLIIQPTAYHSYCSLCMFSAFISITLVGPSMAEVLAALQQLARKYTRPTEWQAELAKHERGVPKTAVSASDWDAEGLRLRYLFGLMAGLFLMAAPAAIGFTGYERVNVRVVGPLVITLSMLSLWPATRWFARLNAIAGLWLVVGPILLQSPLRIQLPEIAIGALLVALATFPGEAAPIIGGGWIGILGRGSEIPERE